MFTNDRQRRAAFWKMNRFSESDDIAPKLTSMQIVSERQKLMKRLYDMGDSSYRDERHEILKKLDELEKKESKFASEVQDVGSMSKERKIAAIDKLVSGGNLTPYQNIMLIGLRRDYLDNKL